MDLIQSIILGFIQGITEFLPISSTAHLVIIPWLFSWNDKGLPFNVALHIGSLFAILVYFYHDWKRIIPQFLKSVSRGSFKGNHDGMLGLYIVIGTIPGIISGYVFESYSAGILRNPLSIAAALALFAIFLYIADRRTKNRKEIKDMDLTDCLFFGIAQAFAVIPGISRSGAAITGGLFRNFKRDEAARFSFLLAAPLITGAGVLESRHIPIDTMVTAPFLLGILSSAVTAFFVIKFLLRFLQKQSYKAFVIYRIALAAVIVILSIRHFI